MSLTFSSSQVYRPAVILPMALVLLVAAAALLWINLAQTSVTERAGAKASPTHRPATVALLVSRAGIPRGQLIGAADVAVKFVTPSKLPAGALSHMSDAEGHMALGSIPSGAPILKAGVSDRAIQGLSARVPENYRAYALAVSEANIAGGFIEAGDRVDLYVTLPGALFAQARAPAHGDQSRAALLLQSVAVLAVGAKLKGDGTPQPMVRTVTLAVSADDLAKLALATRLGTISFAIRNPADDGRTPVSQAELASLAGASGVAPGKREGPAGIRRGVPLLAGRERSFLPVP